MNKMHTGAFAVQVIQKAVTSGAASNGKLHVLGLPGSSGVSYAPIDTWDRVNFTSRCGADGIVRANLVAPPTPTAEQQSRCLSAVARQCRDQGD